jgi:hypothetical protein
MDSEIVCKSPADNRPVADSKKSGRSRITNGALLPGCDGRGAWVRRCRDLISEFINVHLAGADNCSPAERAIVRRIAVLVTELERLEAKFAAKNEASPDQLLLYGRTANTLRRLLEAIGLQRRSRNLNPSPDEYLARLSKEPVLEAEAESVP